MPILNYTTKIRADRTVNEIQNLLGSKGAQRVAVDFAGGQIVAVTFALDLNGTLVNYRLPCNPEGVLLALRKQRVPRGF